MLSGEASGQQHELRFLRGLARNFGGGEGKDAVLEQQGGFGGAFVVGVYLGEGVEVDREMFDVDWGVGVEKYVAELFGLERGGINQGGRCERKDWA